MKRLVGVLVAIAMLGVLPGMALAASITTLLPSGPIRFHLTDFETFVFGGASTQDASGGAIIPGVTTGIPAGGCGGAGPACPAIELRGLFSIDQGITGFVGGSPFYTGTVDSLITGTLTGALVASVTPTANGANVDFTGGILSVFEHPAGPVPAPVITDLGLAGAPPVSVWTTGNAGVLLADLTLEPGIDGATITLSSAAIASNPPTSLGSFFADVTGGSLQARLDTNFFGTPFGFRDIQGQTTVIQEDPAGTFKKPYGCVAGNCFNFTSSDPIKAVVPNPSAALLLGTALLGLVGMARLRKRTK